MKVKELLEALKDLPQDYNVDIGKFMALDLNSDLEDPSIYEVRMDYPLIGVAQHDEAKEVVFMVGGEGSKELCYLLKFGDVKKLVDDEENN